jgi:lysophospholipase L1-like esterase
MYTKYFNFFSILLLIFLSNSILNASTRILPLGDSITYDERSVDNRSKSIRSGYRSHLWYQLASAKFDADFVGSQIAGQSVTPAFDPENEGHPGWDQFEIAEKTSKYMNNSNPDIVLLHIGTNDVDTTNPSGINNILDSIKLYADTNKKEVLIYVALIIDRRESDGRIRGFNNNLALLLTQRIKNGDDIVIVNMYKNAQLTSRDYADRTHPNDNGYRKMANVWFKALTTPFNPTLSAFPFTLVQTTKIISSSIDSKSKTIDIITTIPSNGIQF